MSEQHLLKEKDAKTVKLRVSIWLPIPEQPAAMQTDPQDHVQDDLQQLESDVRSQPLAKADVQLNAIGEDLVSLSVPKQSTSMQTEAQEETSFASLPPKQSTNVNIPSESRSPPADALSSETASEPNDDESSSNFRSNAFHSPLSSSSVASNVQVIYILFILLVIMFV